MANKNQKSAYEPKVRQKWYFLVERLAVKYLTSENLLALKKAKEGDTLIVSSFTRYKIKNLKNILVNVCLKKEKGIIMCFEDEIIPAFDDGTHLIILGIIGILIGFIIGIFIFV